MAKLVIICLLLLEGCTTLQVCASADAVTTVAGVKSGLIREANPLWKSSVNAGHFVPFILVTVGAVMLIEWLNEPVVTNAAAGVECGLAGHNLFLMR